MLFMTWSNLVGRERVELSSVDYESTASTDMLTARYKQYNIKADSCQETVADFRRD